VILAREEREEKPLMMTLFVTLRVLYALSGIRGQILLTY